MNMCTDLLRSKVDLIFKMCDEYIQTCTYIKNQKTITSKEHGLKDVDFISTLNSNKKKEQLENPNEEAKSSEQEAVNQELFTKFSNLQAETIPRKVDMLILLLA